MISFEGSKAFLAYSKKRLPGNSSSWIKEGVVQSNLHRYLTNMFKTYAFKTYSSDELMMVISSTRVERIHYCQAGLGSNRSLRSKTEDFGNDHLRWDEFSTPARGTFGNHDFIVLDLNAPRRCCGELCSHSIQFSIRAEKEGGGQGGGDPGIYINGLTRQDRHNLTLQGNIIASYNGYSTLVPLDVLVRNLYEGHDTQYNLLNNNCWVYAKAACKSVLDLLRRQAACQSGLERHQDIYNQGHYCLQSPDLYWAESIAKVEKSVLREDELQLFVAGNFSSRVRVIAILSMRHVRNLHHVIIEKWKIFRNMREFAKMMMKMKILEKDFPEFDEMMMSLGVRREFEMILERYLPVSRLSSEFYIDVSSKSKMMMSQRVRREFEMILETYLPVSKMMMSSEFDIEVSSESKMMMPSGVLRKFKMILEKHFPEFVMMSSPVMRRKFEEMISLGVRGTEGMRSWPPGPSLIGYSDTFLSDTFLRLRGMRFAVTVCGPWPLILYEPKINWSNLIYLFLTHRKSRIELISLLREILTLKTLELGESFQSLRR
ncbi:hypothetical protein MPTK1_4g20540 [Marchantia polymorpha subsp. ruderalis]|uniref:PPPDE domain-containing protein n=1 Tax=Marchantia polymorpha subsp. ruderalis TaxID=1480154 RepID=A0AAF6BC02_MARPO|nr:hypothetical protein Mp_4g20540 [Marchantia polymorpha subsp. ruderalis]